MQSSCRKSIWGTCTCGSRTIDHVPVTIAQGIETGQWNSRWRGQPEDPPVLRFQRLCEQLQEKRFQILHLNICYGITQPLIMDTSLAPSPMARVTAFLARFISSTTSAFWSGVTRQQMTALHCEAMSRNLYIKLKYVNDGVLKIT